MAVRLTWNEQAGTSSYLVGVYLRETRRKNKDGSVVSYLQLAHNERHPETGSPVARVIHNFGRADQLDREALRRLVASISRFLEPHEAASVGAGLEEVEVVDARRCGGAYALDALFARLGISAALRTAAQGRRLDAELVERVCFALTAQRALDVERHAIPHPGRQTIPHPVSCVSSTLSDLPSQASRPVPAAS